MPISRGLYIASLDAKDLILAAASDRGNGYSLMRKDGTVNYRKFTNVLDHSLESIKLQEVYQKAYRNSKMTFTHLGKEFTRCIINVTFKYNVYEYNRVNADTYVKYGYNVSDLTFEDNVCVRNGELAGIRIGQEVLSPVDDSLLGKSFCYTRRNGEPTGIYELKSGIKTVYTCAQARNLLYQNGFTCDGIHYVRFKRSSGSARVGKCLFIDEKLYARMHRWECCGLKIRKGQKIDLAAWESYISLTSSSIIDTLQILPENILVIHDYKSVFEDDVVATRAVDGNLVTKEEHVTISNNIWDGQSLIDQTLMGMYDCYGMVLLRNRFFKSCCFNTNIQQWFADHNITKLSQLNGYTRATRIEDVKLITTPSSIKYLKFGTLDQWLDHLEPTFGVVKHEKPTHYFNGKFVQTHYQLINTLQLSEREMEELLAESLEYARLLRTDVAVMRHHLKFNLDSEFENSYSPVQNKNDIVFRMLDLNDQFEHTRIYEDFKKKLISAYLKNIRYGHILVRGNYATLLGNPVEMLQHAIGRFTGESQIGIGNIHCKNFAYGKTLLGSRSPHVTIGNMWLPTNQQNSLIDTYFNLSKEICCMNSIGENVLNRLSGSDFDSDAVMLTDHNILIQAARKNYDHFKVPTGLVSADKANRYFTDEQKADLDVKTSVNKIGEIINFSQMLNSLLWDNLAHGQSIEDNTELYCDIAQLDVMSNLEIDKAKKIFTTDNAVELRKMKQKYKCVFQDADGKEVKPNFFLHLARKKGYYIPSAKNYRRHQTSMDCLQKIINSYRIRTVQKKEYIPFSDILDKSQYDSSLVNYHQIRRITDLIRDQKDSIRQIYAKSEEEMDRQTKYFLSNDIKLATLQELSKMKFTYSTAYALMKRIESEEYADIRSSTFFALMGIPNKTFYDAFLKSKSDRAYLTASDTGNVILYGMNFAKVYKKAC